jgi:hypothetical protein
MAVKADPSKTPVSCAKRLNDFRGLICSLALHIPNLFISQHNPLRPPLFHRLGYTWRCGNWRVRIFMTKLTDTFSVSFFPCKTSFQYKFWPPIDTSNKDWMINATYYRDQIRPPSDRCLSALMTHSAISSYVSHFREMLHLLCAVAAIFCLFERTVLCICESIVAVCLSGKSHEQGVQIGRFCWSIEWWLIINNFNVDYDKKNTINNILWWICSKHC